MLRDRERGAFFFFGCSLKKYLLKTILFVYNVYVNKFQIIRRCEMKAVWVLFLTMLITGCATGPKTAVRPRSLNGNYVVYFEQSDRVPKDVLMAGTGGGGTVAATVSSIPPDAIKEVVEEIVAILPEMSKNYSSERMYNALLGRRMLFTGYETPEQLEKVRGIIEAMDKSIEAVVPQNK